jgi:hypothetical protein
MAVACGLRINVTEEAVLHFTSVYLSLIDRKIILNSKKK